MLKYIICGLLGLLLSSCAEKQAEEQNKEKSAFGVYKDELGRDLRLDTVPKRILPLCASSLEFLMVLCDTADIIGRTPECTSPDWIARKPVVNNYPLDMEKILLLKPDLIVSKEGMLSNDQLQTLEDLGLNVYMQKSNSIPDLLKSLSRLGFVLGKKKKGDLYAASLVHQFDRLKDQCGHEKGSAIAIISTDPLYVYGYTSYVSDLLMYVGLKNVIDSTIDQVYPVIDQEFLLQANPDYLILPLYLKESQTLFTTYPLLKKLKAYQNNNCLYINDDWLSRPSPNLIKAAQYMATEICEHEKK